MRSLGVVAVIERRPLLYFATCVLVVLLCIALQTSSFFRLGSRTSAALVACLHATLLHGDVPLMSAILDSLRGFHRSGRFWCLAAYIPKPNFLIGRLRFKQWLLLDLLSLGVSQARCIALDP
jgi:hypothetical protein